MAKKPTPKPDKRDELMDLLVDQLHLILTRGVPLTDQDGNAVMLDGKPIFKPPPAAYLREVRQLCQQLGIGAVARPNGEDRASRLLKAAREHGNLRLSGLPPISEERDVG